MGRDTTADSTPILKQAEQNLGNSTILVPSNPDCTATGIPITVIPNTNPARLLNLTGGSAVAQTISIVMMASRIVGADNPNPGYAGPVTGIVEFGNGGRFTRVEFDVPVGAYTGYFTQAANALDPQAGGQSSRSPPASSGPTPGTTTSFSPRCSTRVLPSRLLSSCTAPPGDPAARGPPSRLPTRHQSSPLRYSPSHCSCRP